MSSVAWALCAGWITAAAALAVAGARRGAAEGRVGRATARLKSPTIYLFAAYLLVAAIVTPHEPGETSSPLIGLVAVLPVAYALATFSAIGREGRTPVACAALGLFHGGAVVAGAVVVLALASPAYLPGALR